MPWNDFEQTIWKQSKEWPQEIFLNSWVIAVSGGLDSIVLLHVLQRLARALKITLEVVHFHHGHSIDPIQVQFRNRAAFFVRELLNNLDVKIRLTEFKYKDHKELTSEADFRAFRKFHIQDFLKQQKVIAIGHHQDDLLETRLIRAIRGTGSRGLKAMNQVENRTQEGGFIIRPLLGFTRKEIEQYAKDQKLSWLEDPSNQDSKYLRNWLRNIWLPALEAKRPGALNCLAKSMDRFSLGEVSPFAIKIEEVSGRVTFSRIDFNSAEKAQKKQTIADAFLALKISNYTENHIFEVLKRLDINRSRLTFRIAGTLWLCDAQQICASRA